MQVLILYYSRSGNTHELAKAIAEGVKQVDDAQAIVRSTSEVTKDDFLNSHGIIAGSPVYFGTMAAELKHLFDEYVIIRRKMENKVGAAFATSSDPSGGKETTLLSILQAMLIYGMIIVGDPMEATGHYGVSCTGSPDEKTKKNAVALGKRVASLAKRIREQQ
ncbi:MAG: NAD(P)H-dependent oxidoreductase [Spirochaetes bacterium]|nr:NAD(P)H-dependent oxidoreductase [Spirochaetota bacterium]MBP8987499.1 NAD(P)H-dependent oxidoreductase [Spirochaetota bacterium]